MRAMQRPKSQRLVSIAALSRMAAGIGSLVTLVLHPRRAAPVSPMSVVARQQLAVTSIGAAARSLTVAADSSSAAAALGLPHALFLMVDAPRRRSLATLIHA